MSFPWKPEEVKLLKSLVKEKKSKEEISKELNRTPTAIEVKVNRLGLQLWRPNRIVRDSELKDLEKDWNDGSLSMNQLSTKYGRTKNGLVIIAQRNNFGPRPYDDEFISIPDIVEYVGISADSVRNWIKNGLKAKRNHSGAIRYLIDIDDLEEFMKNNQHRFNATKVSEYLFSPEPEWLKEKRKQDKVLFAESTRLRQEFSNEDDKKLIHMLKSGRSVKDMAKEFKRSEKAIRARLEILGYYAKKWNDYEIDIIKENVDYLTTAEIAKLLPRRTEKSIRYKCESLGIHYHITKERCKKR